MKFNELLKRFNEKPYLLDMGKGKLSQWLKVSKDDIVRAKKLVRMAKKAKNKKRLPKILIFDIETAPLKAYVWSRWKQNIYLDQTISEWFMLTWSAKWLYNPEVMSNRLTGKEALAEDDSRIIKDLWELINEADMVVAHNGDRFDIPKMNARFLLNGLPPTTSYKSIDTKKVACKQFGFSSNKLDALARYFHFDTKLDTDFDLWSKCMDGNEEALEYMEKYNQYDVELLEEVYLKLRPWIKSHPNVGLYLEADVPVCANCGNEHLLQEGYYYTNVGRFETYRCTCGAISRVRLNDYPKKAKKHLLASVAK